MSLTWLQLIQFDKGGEQKYGFYPFSQMIFSTPHCHTIRSPKVRLLALKKRVFNKKYFTGNRGWGFKQILDVISFAILERPFLEIDGQQLSPKKKCIQ